MMPPIHPGEVLREEFLKPLGISANQLAKEAGLGISLIADLLDESGEITPETARRLAKHFGTTANFWMNLQTSYERECRGS